MAVVGVGCEVVGGWVSWWEGQGGAEEGDGYGEDEEDQGLEGKGADEEVLVTEVGEEECEGLEDAAGARSDAGRRGRTVGDFGVDAKGAFGQGSLTSDKAFVGDVFFELMPHLGTAVGGFESSPESMSRDGSLAFAGCGWSNAFKRAFFCGYASSPALAVQGLRHCM